jgi:hypothetical protein
MARKVSKDQQVAKLQEQLAAQVEVTRLAQAKVEELEGRVTTAEALLKTGGSTEDAQRIRLAKHLFSCPDTASWDDIVGEILSLQQQVGDIDATVRQAATRYEVVEKGLSALEVVEKLCQALGTAQEEIGEKNEKVEEVKQAVAETRESAIYLLKELGIDTYAFEVDAEFDDTQAILKTKALNRPKIATKTTRGSRRTTPSQLRLA